MHKKANKKGQNKTFKNVKKLLKCIMELVKCVTDLLKSIANLIDLSNGAVVIPVVTILIMLSINQFEKNKNGDNGVDNTAITSKEIDIFPPNKEDDDKYLIGSELILVDVYLYAAADEKQRTENKVSGEFYVYDGINVNGFLRVCQPKFHVGKKPIEENVTGWVKIADLD